MTHRLRTFVAVEAALVAAFVLVSVLVVEGACTGIDQHAIDHWMMNVSAGPVHTSVGSAFRPYPNGGNASQIVFNVWTFPASVVVSGAVLVACCIVLRRRGLRTIAGAWVVAWLFANAVEVIGKGLLHRPALSVGVNGIRMHLAGFDSSFPSGHTARGLVLAFMVAAVWPRLAWPAALWGIGTCVFLVLSAAHTPSDVLGGTLVAVSGVVWVRFCGRIAAL
jgi:membrane-associated phospholipid phosphatase